MRLVRYGEAGNEKPGLIDDDHVLRDLSEDVGDIAGEFLGRAQMERIRAIDPKSLAKADPSHRIGSPTSRRSRSSSTRHPPASSVPMTTSSCRAAPTSSTGRSRSPS